MIATLFLTLTYIIHKTTIIALDKLANDSVYASPVGVTVIAFYDYTIAQCVGKRFSSALHVDICDSLFHFFYTLE